MIQCANMPMKYQKWIIQILAYSHIGTLNHYYFSIRIRASTANKPLSVATNGFISISFISLAKRNKVERRTIMSAYCCSSMPFCPRVPLMIGYPLRNESLNKSHHMITVPNHKTHPSIPPRRFHPTRKVPHGRNDPHI